MNFSLATRSKYLPICWRLAMDIRVSSKQPIKLSELPYWQTVLARNDIFPNVAGLVMRDAVDKGYYHGIIQVKIRGHRSPEYMNMPPAVYSSRMVRTFQNHWRAYNSPEYYWA